MRRLLAVLLLATPGVAQAQATGQDTGTIAGGNAAAGHAVARIWCAACHAVDAGSPARATDAAPPGFAAIAGKPGVSADSLRAALQTGHGQMPDFRLDRNQTSDVLAYILSLRR